MTLLHEVDQPASDIQQYLANLEAIIEQKIDLITSLKDKVTSFKEHLAEEESLSKKFYDQRNEAAESCDVYNGIY